MRFRYNDGGREAAGYNGHVGDCVTRAIAIASGVPYQEIYDALAKGNASQIVSHKQRRRIEHQWAKRGASVDTKEFKAYIRSRTKVKTAAHGIDVTRKWFKDYMRSLGFLWVPTMEIGAGTTVHLKEDELPEGRLVVNVSKHFTAVIDGELNDTHDCSRKGTRCVYGYYILQENLPEPK